MIQLMDRRLVFGINPTFRDDVPGFNAQMVARMVAAYCQSSPLGINWDLIQPTGSSDWQWGPFDEKVDLLFNNGIEIIGGIVGTPWWAKFINEAGTGWLTSGYYKIIAWA